MAINLSLYDGVPTTKESELKQWVDCTTNPKKYGFFGFENGWLIQKKNINGKYKGYVCLWYYERKPSCKYLKAIKIKDLEFFKLNASIKAL